MVDQAGDCKKVFNFHLVISSVLRKYRSIHSLYCCWLPTLGCIAWSSFHWIHWNANHIHQHVTYRVAIPQVLEQCGGFDGKNAPIGGAIALDICKAPTFAQGPPLREADDMWIISSELLYVDYTSVVTTMKTNFSHKTLNEHNY